ncbi:hypothetical protein MJL81_33920, partial [Salmonella enterica subsp. enterica serovar Anatum]|nr:hypothetical protein [Salmonella enterica subsp. enterica serovar Anatum]
PNPLLPECRDDTRKAVIEHGADMGIAFDGDFDRCFLFDEKGQDVSGKSAAAVAHWQRISQFRARHPAIGAGQQTTLTLKHGYG